MDLSKAFDCLHHNLLLLKLENYGVSENSLRLLQSYLTGRKQCVKIESVCSSFLDIYKGAPQISILGPVMFNVFINDIFDFVKKEICTIMQMIILYLMETTVKMMLLKLLKNRVIYLLSGLLKITRRLILINFRPFQLIGDRPFNLQGGGGLWFFVSFKNFCSDNTRVRIFIFCPEFNIRLYDKNSESDYFFSFTKIRIFFSATLGIRIFF